MVGYSIGFGCIPYLLLGELFPAQQRSVASAIAGSFNLGVMFVVIKTYHYLDAVMCNFRLYSFGVCTEFDFHVIFLSFLIIINNTQLITTAGTFWMYSIFCALAVVFVIFVVPETKGRDLDDIAKLFIKADESDESIPINSIKSKGKSSDGPTLNEMDRVQCSNC